MNNDVTLAYRTTDAITADPLGLVVLLYDILLKDIREAIEALDARDVERRAAAIRHSMLVLQQLQGTLDMERGGVVAENLDRFYNFTRAKLLEAQIKMSKEMFEQQVTFVASIREAWKEVRGQQLAAEESAALPQATAPAPFLGTPDAPSAQWSA
jgi:flagellar protein FliS